MIPKFIIFVTVITAVLGAEEQSGGTKKVVRTGLSTIQRNQFNEEISESDLINHINAIVEETHKQQNNAAYTNAPVTNNVDPDYVKYDQLSDKQTEIADESENFNNVKNVTKNTNNEFILQIDEKNSPSSTNEGSKDALKNNSENPQIKSTTTETDDENKYKENNDQNDNSNYLNIKFHSNYEELLSKINPTNINDKLDESLPKTVNKWTVNPITIDINKINKLQDKNIAISSRNKYGEDSNNNKINIYAPEEIGSKQQINEDNKSNENNKEIVTTQETSVETAMSNKNENFDNLLKNIPADCLANFQQFLKSASESDKIKMAEFLKKLNVLNLKIDPSEINVDNKQSMIENFEEKLQAIYDNELRNYNIQNYNFNNYKTVQKIEDNDKLNNVKERFTSGKNPNQIHKYYQPEVHYNTPEINNQFPLFYVQGYTPQTSQGINVLNQNNAKYFIDYINLRKKTPELLPPVINLSNLNKESNIKLLPIPIASQNFQSYIKANQVVGNNLSKTNPLTKNTPDSQTNENEIPKIIIIPDINLQKPLKSSTENSNDAAAIPTIEVDLPINSNHFTKKVQSIGTESEASDNMLRVTPFQTKQLNYLENTIPFSVVIPFQNLGNRNSGFPSEDVKSNNQFTKEKTQPTLSNNEERLQVTPLQQQLPENLSKLITPSIVPFNALNPFNRYYGGPRTSNLAYPDQNLNVYYFNGFPLIYHPKTISEGIEWSNNRVGWRGNAQKISNTQSQPEESNNESNINSLVGETDSRSSSYGMLTDQNENKQFLGPKIGWRNFYSNKPEPENDDTNNSVGLSIQESSKMTYTKLNSQEPQKLNTPTNLSSSSDNKIKMSAEVQTSTKDVAEETNVIAISPIKAPSEKTQDIMPGIISKPSESSNIESSEQLSENKFQTDPNEVNDLLVVPLNKTNVQHFPHGLLTPAGTTILDTTGSADIYNAADPTKPLYPPIKPREPIYEQKYKFILPYVLKQSIQPISQFPNAIDPFAYYPRTMQPQLMNVPVPYSPVYHMIRRLFIPNQHTSF